MQDVTAHPYSPITGKGLGVCYSSLNKAGPLFAQAGMGAAGVMFYPNLCNGNLFLKDRILSIPQLNFTLNLGFVYNSQVTDPTKAWRFYHKKFVALPNVNNPGVLEESDGHLTKYIQSKDQSNLYFAEDSLGGTKCIRFDSINNFWLMHDPETGIVEIYDTNGLLQRRMDVTGRATVYEYDNNQQLSKITTPSGNHYQIVRYQNTITIMDADQNRALQEYTFDAQNRLLNSTTPDGYNIQYTYVDNTSLIYHVTQSDNSFVHFGFRPQDPNGQVLDSFQLGQSQVGDESSYEIVRVKYADSEHPNQATVSNKTGNTTVVYDQNSDLTQVSRQKGYDVPDKDVDITTYAYTSTTRQLASITTPGNGKSTREYDAAFRNVLEAKTQPNQQIIDFVHNTDSETVEVVCKITYPDPNNLHLPAYERYVYEEIEDKANATISLFLRFKISPEGRVTEYRRLPNDAKRNIDTERTYLAGFYTPNVQVVSLDEMQQWVSKQDASQVSLTKYHYDKFGNADKITEYTTIDAQGNGIQNGSTGVKQINRNLFGSIETTKVNTLTTPAVTQQDFDSLQRLKRKVDALKNQTRYVYNDAQSQVSVTYPNASTKLQQSNPRGFCISTHATALTVDGQNTQVRDTQYTRDGGGRIAITTLPDGSKLYSYYDRQDRVGFTVSALGIVTQYIYDTQNRFNTTIQYANPVDVNKLWIVPPTPGLTPDASTLESLIKGIKDPVHDRVSYTFFDKSNRRQYKVDAENYLTQYLHDGLNNRIGVIRYATPLTNQQITQLQSGSDLGLVPDFTKDRCTRNFYDKDGLLIGQQNAAGFVTQFVLDGGGRITQKNLYYTKVPLNLAQSFDTILGVLKGTKAGTTLYSYDARGQMAAKLDAEGYYTAYLYSPDGLRIAAHQYAQKPTGKFPTAPATDLLDQTTTYAYDLLGRRTKTNSPFNRVDNVQFDVMGNIILNNGADTSANGKTDGDSLRQTATQFDGWNQAVNKANVYIGKLLAEAGNDQTKIQQIWANQSQRNKYDQTGLLLSTTDSLGNTTYIYYDADRRPVIKISARLTVEESTLDSFGKEIVNRKYKNFYNGPLTGGLITPEFRQALNKLQDPLDQIKTYQRDKRGFVKTILDAKGNQTQKAYNAFGQVSTELLPINSAQPTLEVKHDYDTRGNEVTTTKTDTLTNTVISESWEFNNPLNKETKYVNAIRGEYTQEHDLLGNVTQKSSGDVVRNALTYDFLSRVKTETDAYKNTKTHEYGPDHTHTVTSPDGVTKHTLQLSAFNQTLQDADTLNNTTQATHAPDGQVETETDQLKNKSSQEFNNIAQKKTVTDAQLVQTAIQYNPVGQVDAIVNAVNTDLKQPATCTRDAFENVISTTDAMGTQSQQSFDQNNYLKEVVTDAVVGGLNLVKTFEHNAQGTVSITTEGDVKNKQQYVEQTLIDGFNRVIGSVVDPGDETHLNITTKKELDAVGNIVKITDPDKNVTRNYFTPLKLMRFTVTQEGQVTEKFYDANNKIKYHRVFAVAKKVDDSTSLADLEAFASNQTSNSQNSLLYYFYDANGNEVYQVNSLGAVSQSIYNTANPQAVIETVQYYKQIDPSVLNPNLTTSELAALVVQNANDRSTIYVRNAKGQSMRVVDPEGFVRDQIFNEVGKAITVTQYANPIIVPLDRTQPLPDPVKNPVNDRTTYFVYDSLDRKIFEVESFDIDKANGRVTQFFYDKNNNPVQTCKYADTFIIDADYKVMVTKLLALKPDKNKDNIDVQGFDNANRLIQKTNGLNKSDLFEKNALGLITTHTDKMGNAWGSEFDAAKRCKLSTEPQTDIFDVKKAADNTLSLVALGKASVQTKKEYYSGGKEKQVTHGVNTQNPRIAEFVYDGNEQLTVMQTQNVPVDDPTKNGSFENFPTTQQTLQQQFVYNAKKLKVAERDESGNWVFYVHNSEGKEVYSIDGEGAVKKQERNAFGEVERVILFEESSGLDLTQYQTTGIPLDVIKAAMENKLANPNNRIIRNTFNKKGKPVNQKVEGQVFCYSVNENGDSTCELLAPETRFQYNAFSDLTYKGVLQSRNIWAEEFYWVNRAGKRIAAFNFNGRVDLYGYTNPFHLHTGLIQWSGSTTQRPTPLTTYAQLLTYHQDNPGKPDRVHLLEYDVIGQKSGEGLSNAVAQQLVTSNPLLGPYLENLPAKTLVTRYVRNAMGKVVATIYPTGAVAYTFYDARGFEVATTGVPQRRNDGSVFIPLTYKFPNAYGQEVGRTKFEAGAELGQYGLLPPLITPPQPLALDPAKDQTQLKLLDTARGNPLITQDANNDLMGFTCNATGQIARTFRWCTNKLSDTMIELTLHEIRFTFDANKKPTSKAAYIDGVQQYKLLSLYNLFGDNIAEGSVSAQGQAVYYLFTEFDIIGKPWKTNRQKGVNTILLRNAAGHVCLSAVSQTQDLSTVKYTDIQALLASATRDTLMQTRTRRDLANRGIVTYLPDYESQDPNSPGNISLSMAVGAQYPDIGKISISWPHPAVTIVVPTMTISPVGNTQQKITIPIKKIIRNPQNANRLPLLFNTKGSVGPKRAMVTAAFPQNYHAGISKSNGDSFFDAIAQELNRIIGHNEITVETIRELCKNCDENNWIAVSTVIADHFNVRLHVIGLHDNPNKKDRKKNPFVIEHSVVDSAGMRVVEENEVDWKDTYVLHLAVISQHFVPVNDVPIKSTEVRFGVDLSAYPSDVYEYSIEYHLDDDDKKLLYKTIGQFQCDTGIVAGSQRLVVDVQNGSTLFLTGNTTNLTAVKLLKDGVQVGQDIPVPASHLVDLSGYQSGEYTVQPVVTGQDNLPHSLPFTIFTNTLSNTPLAEEIDATFGLQYVFNNELDPGKAYFAFRLDWTVLGILNNAPVEVTLNYQLGREPATSKTFSINHATDAGHFASQNGGQLTANMVIPSSQYAGPQPPPPLTLLSLSVALVLDDKNKLVICNSYPSVSSTGDGYYRIETFTFQPTTTLFIAPVTSQPTVMKYLDSSSGYEEQWKELSAVGSTSVGVVFDVTGLDVGNYPYQLANTPEELRENHHNRERRKMLAKINKKEMDEPELDVFSIGRGSQVYSSTRFLTSPESQKPKREKRFDNYGNVIKTIDTQGYETDNDFDVRNKLVQTTYPEVPVNNKNGTYSKMRPTTKRGYNERGVKIGRTDGNNHTTGFVVDENGQPLKKILPDGTVIEQKTFNALQQMVVFTDSRGKNYTFGFDGKNNIIWRETPLKLIERFWYNEAGFLGSVTDSAGKTRYYVRDINGNIVANISPMNKKRQFVYDLLSNKPIRQINSDGSFLSSVVDAFGFTHQHIELDGSEVFTEYNFLMQVIHLSSQGGNHGTLLSYVMVTGRIPGGYAWGTYYQITTTPTPPQDLHFTYRQDGIISGAFDMAWPRTTELIHDSERRQISFKATEAGTLIRQIVSAYDAMSRPRLTYGTQEIIKMSYDGTINIIQRTVTLIPPIGNPVVDDSWNLPGPNDDMQIYAGALVKVGNNSQIGIQPNKGEAYSSQFGLRTTQSYQDDKGVTHTETLSYDDDSRLSGSSSTDGFVTSRTYDGAGRPNGYSSNYPTDPHGTSQSQGCTYDDDSELLTANTSMTTWKLIKVIGMWIWMPTTNQSDTTYGNLNGYGMPGSQQSVYPQPDDDPVVDNLTDTYVNREIPELVEVAGTRTDSDGEGPWNSANNFTGTNPGELTGQSQTQDLTQASVLRQDCLFGMTLQRADFHGDGIPGINSTVQSLTLNSYFYDILRNIAGSMSMRLSAGQSSNFGVNMGNMMPGVRGVLAAAGPAVSDVTTDFTIGKKMINPVDKSYPPMSSGIVDVKDGDTLETIAQQNCGTTQAVSAIQALNGGINDQQLVNGNTIKLPQWIQSKYQVTTTEDYNILVNSIMVNLYPQLIAAQPDDDDGFWDEFIDVVIVVVAVAIGAATGGTLAIPAAVAAAALMEAGAEEGEIALGMRSEFSWKAVIQIAIEAGFAEYAAANIPTSFEAAVMQAGKLAVEEQLLEIATGVQNGFNIQEVLIQMASAGIMYQANLAINPEVPEAQQAVRVGNQVVSTTTNRTVDEFVKYTELNLIGTVSSGILTAAFEGQKIDLESMAAQFLGSEVGKILSETPMVKDIGNGIQEIARANPWITSMVSGVNNVVDDIGTGITKVENAVERFFDPAITSPNAEASAQAVKQQSSQARAMARHGFHAQPRVLNHADANGNYIGTNLGIPDDSAIDDFDPNSYGDNSSATVSGSGVNRVPSARVPSDIVNSSNTFWESAVQELPNLLQGSVHPLAFAIKETAAYFAPSAVKFGEAYVAEHGSIGFDFFAGYGVAVNAEVGFSQKGISVYGGIGAGEGLEVSENVNYDFQELSGFTYKLEISSSLGIVPMRLGASAMFSPANGGGWAYNSSLDTSPGEGLAIEAVVGYAHTVSWEEVDSGVHRMRF